MEETPEAQIKRHIEDCATLLGYVLAFLAAGTLAIGIVSMLAYGYYTLWISFREETAIWTLVVLGTTSLCVLTNRLYESWRDRKAHALEEGDRRGGSHGITFPRSPR